MRLSELVEAVKGPNRFFTVVKKFGGFKPGERRPYSLPTYRSATAFPGDEIHFLGGGTFLIDRDGNVDVDGFRADDPDRGGEAEYHQYKHDPTGFKARELQAKVDSGHLEEISKNEAKKVQYRS